MRSRRVSAGRQHADKQWPQIARPEFVTAIPSSVDRERWHGNESVITTKTKITKEYLIEQANDILLKAKANGAWAAARGANELLAKLNGHLVEKRDMRMIRSFADLTDEEIAALVSEGEADAAGIRH
jgi:hypothetical protein